MNQHNSIVSIGLLIVLIGAISAGMYFGILRFDKFLELKARNDCAMVSRYTLTIESDNVVVYYPVTDIYRKCLDEKGYKN